MMAARNYAIVAALLAGVLAPPAQAHHSPSAGHAPHADHAPRNRNVPAEFQRQHPCPSTGATGGACPGYVRDHVKSLCKGGPDSAGNMQWQSLAQGKAKDRWECKR